jgi:CRISPR-associated protein Cas2
MARWKLLVSYDVNTEDKAGRNRLRRVAKRCESHGQRVQKSVFECSLTQMELEDLERQLLEIMDEAKDNLRIYRLSDTTNWAVKEYGCFRAVDFEAPLVI